MSTEKSYWVVEYRFPIAVSEASSPEEAAKKASESIQSTYGFIPSNWFARVFEYGPSNDEVGPLAEYFCNPSGTSFRKLNQNDEDHGRMFHEKTKDENNE